MHIVKIKNKKQITNIKRVSADNHFHIIIRQCASRKDQNTIGLNSINKEIIY
jgi:hypothetical protein